MRVWGTDNVLFKIIFQHQAQAKNSGCGGQVGLSEEKVETHVLRP